MKVKFKAKKILTIMLLMVTATQVVYGNDNSAIEVKGNESKEVTSEEALIESVWGTSPVSFDSTTGTLTVYAGTLGEYRQNRYLDNNNLIRTDTIINVILEDGVVAPENSTLLFAGNDVYKNFTYLRSIKGTWDTSNVTDFSLLFADTYYLVDIDMDIENWDVSKVDNMHAMFYRTGTNVIGSYKILNLTNWDTSKVKTMDNMFWGSDYDEIHIENFDVSSVETFKEMFTWNDKIEKLDISKWNISSTANLYRMFTGVSSLKEIVLGPNTVLSKKMELPDIDLQTGEYTGRWERVDPSDPKIVYESTDDFLEGYNGDNPGTYVWQRSKQSVVANDSKLYVGDAWNESDNFVSAYDKDGNILSFSDVVVTGTVDTANPGFYPITYTNGYKSITIEVEVKDIKTSVSANDSVIYVGDDWNAVDNFVLATDKDGASLNIDDMVVTGTVDNTKPCINFITYTNDTESITIQVEVKEDKTSIVAENIELLVGDEWNADLNFILATDRDGNPLDISNLVVTGDVDTSKPGTYSVTYTSGATSVTVEVVVKAQNPIDPENPGFPTLPNTGISDNNIGYLMVGLGSLVILIRILLDINEKARGHKK